MREIKGTKYIFAFVISFVIIGMLVFNCANSATSETVAANVVNSKAVPLTWTDATGGDHGGANWTPANGAEIAGNHTNISTFTIAAGITVYVKAYDGANYGIIGIQAQNIYINGTLNGDAAGKSNGGAAITLEAITNVFVNKNITINGATIISGGGSGGGILINAMNTIVTGNLYASGGNGGSNPYASAGSGGSGGNILINAMNIIVTGNLYANGGNGGSNSIYSAGSGGIGGKISINTMQRYIGALNVTLNCSLYANGGDGGVASQNAGHQPVSGGCGGDGGSIAGFYYIKNISVTSIVSVTGGIGKNGVDGGSNGADGVDGNVLYKEIDPFPPETTLTLYLPIPNGGNEWYVSDVKANLSAIDPFLSTNTTGVDYIQYKIDNNTWVNYNGNLTFIDGIYTLYYRAVDKGGNTETQKSREIKVDTTKPTSPNVTVKPSIPGGLNGWYVSNVTFSATSNDSTSGVSYYQYTFDRFTWFIGDTFTMSTDTIDIDIAFKAVNGAGLISNTTWCNDTKIDVAHPQTQVYPINPDAPYVTGVPFTVSWGGIDSTSGIQYYDVECKVGVDSQWLSLLYHTTATSTSFSALSEGQTAYFRCRATDNAGNVEDWPTSNEGDVNVTVDCTPPTTSHIFSGSMGSNSWYTSNVEITLSCSDTVSGMNYTEFRINNGAWTIYTDTLTLVDDGTYTLYYHSVDKAGNTEYTKSATIKIDKTSPVTTASLLGTIGNNDWFVSSIEISLSAVDCASGVGVIKYSWDTTFYTYSPSSKPNRDVDGIYTIFYYAVDLAGNQGTTNSLSFKIDKTAPTTSRSLSGSDGSEGWYVSEVTLNLIGSDITSGVSYTKYRIDNDPWKDYSSTVTISTDGIYTVDYCSIDLAGNVETINSFTIKVDRTSPTTSSSLSGSVGNNNWYTSDVIVTLTATDTTSGIACINYRINNGDWQVYCSTFTIFTEDPQTIDFYSKDDASNTETIKSTIIKIDKTAPTTSISVAGTQGNGGWYISDVAVVLTGTDTISGISQTYYQINNGVTQSGTSIALTQSGIYTVKYWSVDNAGNSEQDSSTTIKVDKGKPVVNLCSPAEGEIVTTNLPTLSWSGSDEASQISYYEVQIDNNNDFISPEFTKTTIDTSTATISLLDGVYYWRVRAVDNAGNVGEWLSRSFSISTGPPTNLTIAINSEAQFTNSTQVTLTLSASQNAYEMCFSNDNSTWSVWEAFASTKETNLTLQDGEKKVHFKCRNLYGNESEVVNDTIILDMTSPTTSDNASSGWQVVKPVTVTLTSTDNASGIAHTYCKFWLIGATETDWNEGTAVTVTRDGKWYIKYYSIDNAGNKESCKLIEVWIDTEAPTTFDNAPANWQNVTITITLSAVDMTSGVAHSYYKLWLMDTEEPSSYTEGNLIQITIDGRWDLKYYSVDTAGNTEISNTKEVWLDTLPPSAQITEPQDGWITNKENITVKGAVKDLNCVGSVEILVNDTSYIITLVCGEFSQIVKLAKGTNTIILKAQDPAQNWVEISITITYDPTIPMLVIYMPTNNLITNISQCTVSGETEPEYTITVNGMNFPVNATGYFAGTIILSEGLNIISVTATNPAGTETTVFVYVTLDTIAPVTAHYIDGTWGSNNWYVSNVTLTLNVTDNTTTIIQIKYRINNGSWLDYTAPFTIIKDNASYSVEYYSVDTAGNVEEVKSFYFRLDKTPPITTSDLTGAEGANGWYNSTVGLILTASDTTSNVASIKYKENNGSWCDYIPAQIFSDGEYFIEYYSIDCAGNHEIIKNATFKIDTAPPEPPKNITISPTTWTNINSFSIDWNNPGDTAGIEGAWYKIGSPPAYNQDGAFTYQKPIVVSAPRDGSYAVYVWLQDKAGNVNYQLSATAYVKLDTTAPQTTFLKTGASGNETWYISEVKVEFSILDTDSGLKATYYSFAGNEYQLYTSAFNITKEGIYFIEYYSIDNAGNIELETTAGIKIDKENPTTNATKEGVFGNADWFISNVTVVLKSYDETSGVSACYWSVNNTDYLRYTVPIILSQDGVHTIRYYGTDAAGNIESEKELSVRIDKTAPTTTVLIQGLLGNDDWHVTSLTFTLISQDAISGIKKTEYQINQGIWEEYTDSITLPDGIYTIDYFAVNNADIPEKSQSIVLKVDHTAPITNISAHRYSVKGGEVLFANSTIKFFAEDGTSGVKEIRYCINNSVWSVYRESILLEPGIYIIQYYGVDFAGNTEYSNTNTIIIGEKTLVPIVEITYPGENAELSDNVSVSYTACSILNKTLLVTVKFLYSAGEIIIAENITPESKVKFSTATMENGVYILRIISTDSDGRIGYKEINISVNNKMILGISVPNSVAPNSTVQITVDICNYLHSDECFVAEFYFDDLYIGCNQTSILKIFETEKLSLSYKVNSTTDHCVSVKLFTKNRQLLEEKKIYFAVASAAEEQSNKQAGFNFLQFSIPVFMCACFGILYMSRKRKISSWKMPPLKRTSSSCSNIGQLPHTSNPLKSPEEVQRMIAEYKNKLSGEKNE